MEELLAAFPLTCSQTERLYSLLFSFFFLPSNLTVNSNIFNFNTSIYFFTKATDSLVSIVSFFVLNVFLFYLYKRC